MLKIAEDERDIDGVEEVWDQHKFRAECEEVAGESRSAIGSATEMLG